MKTNELKSIIRGIIQEELKTILPTMIPQILTEILSNNVKNNIRENSKVDDIIPSSVESQPTKSFKKYTNNETLNKVLNETVGGIPKEGSFVGYSSPLMKSDAISSFESQPSQLNESIEQPSLPINKEQSKVMNIMNKDFRSLMKAVDKRKKEGNVSSGRVTAE